MYFENIIDKVYLGREEKKSDFFLIILIKIIKIGYSLNNYITTQSRMNLMFAYEEVQEEKLANEEFPSFKQQNVTKVEEKTATKPKDIRLDQSQQVKIRNELLQLFRHPCLKGNIKVQNFNQLSEVEVTLYHKIKKHNVQENIRIYFTSNYPLVPPQLEIHSCNLSLLHPEYVVPGFLSQIELLTKEKWNEQIQLSDILAVVMSNLNDFHQSEIERVFVKNQEKQNLEESQKMKKEDDQNSIEREVLKKNRRKSSNMTGCADKELTETKNLNRHFRSKLREVLRDLTPPEGEQSVNYTEIDRIFTPNRVGFQDIRKALSNKWFNSAVRRQMNSGQFLHKILRGMMGIKSKKLMIKYYHVMASAVQEPISFTRWKYD